MGLGVVIDSHTGLVLDYEIYCKKCSVCKSIHTKCIKRQITQDYYNSWHKGHEGKCSLNFTGSSGAMEKEAALVLWSRSLDKKLRYTTFIGDGDSATHASLCQKQLVASM